MERPSLSKRRSDFLLARRLMHKDGCGPVPVQESLSYSLYRNPATTAAKIAPPQRSSIHPSGSMRGTGDHAACAKLPGTPAQNPTIMPIFRAVLGPGPAVARLHAYKIRDQN